MNDSIYITGKIIPATTDGILIESQYIKAGYSVVATLNDLENLFNRDIYVDREPVDGQPVYVSSTKDTYRYDISLHRFVKESQELPIFVMELSSDAQISPTSTQISIQEEYFLSDGTSNSFNILLPEATYSNAGLVTSTNQVWRGTKEIREGIASLFLKSNSLELTTNSNNITHTTSYTSQGISLEDGFNSYNLLFPLRGGTLALEEDIPINYITTDTTQIGLSGNKEWSGQHTHLGNILMEGNGNRLGATESNENAQLPVYIASNSNIASSVVRIANKFTLNPSTGAIKLNGTILAPAGINSTYNLLLPAQNGTLATLDDVQAINSVYKVTIPAGTSTTYSNSTVGAIPLVVYSSNGEEIIITKKITSSGFTIESDSALEGAIVYYAKIL